MKANGWQMNIWQGDFPKTNTEDDGFVGLCPTTHFSPNKRGVFNMLGNVWEWTKTRFYKPKDPKAPPPPKNEQPEQNQYVLKGGSYLDSANGEFNHMVSVSTRMGNTPDSGGGNTGFR